MFLYKCKEALKESHIRKDGISLFFYPPSPHTLQALLYQNERIRLLAFVIIYMAGGWSDRHYRMTGGN